MEKTLLEIAKETKGSVRNLMVTQEEIDLANSWMKEEITTGQVSIALNGKGSRSGNSLYRIAVILRYAYAKGKIKL